MEQATRVSARDPRTMHEALFAQPQPSRSGSALALGQ
jgi:hypothetical protein